MDKTLQVLLSNQYEWVPATCQEILSTVERGKDGRGGEGLRATNSHSIHEWPVPGVQLVKQLCNSEGMKDEGGLGRVASASTAPSSISLFFTN